MFSVSFISLVFGVYQRMDLVGGFDSVFYILYLVNARSEKCLAASCYRDLETRVENILERNILLVIKNLNQ